MWEEARVPILTISNIFFNLEEHNFTDNLHVCVCTVKSKFAFYFHNFFVSVIFIVIISFLSQFSPTYCLIDLGELFTGSFA